MADNNFEVNNQDLKSNSETAELQQQSRAFDNAPLDPNPTKETEVRVKMQVSAEEDVRRSQRIWKLTEKGQELHDDKSKKLQHRFTSTYEKWKALVKEAKRALNHPPSSDNLQDLQTKIHTTSTDVKQAYEDLRQHSPPDEETRRRVDTCH